MLDEKKEENKDKLSEFQFIQYIAMLANGGMQHLGKMMNPLTGKTERNLEAAGAIIDMLSMFKEKTKGNLSQGESRVMDEALGNLQLNYADEVARESKKKPAEEKKPGEEKPSEEKKPDEDKTTEEKPAGKPEEEK